MGKRPDFLAGATLDTWSAGAKLRRFIQVALTDISPKLNVLAGFYSHYGRFPDLKDPKDLNEKMAWLKLNALGSDPLVARCANKAAVKDYLIEKGYGDLVVPTLAVYERPEEIGWEALPQRFVLKWNYSYGMNILVEDKAAIDRTGVEAQLKKWGKIDYWKLLAETQYKNVPKRILAEAFIETGGAELADYKFYCFGGVPRVVLYCTGRQHHGTQYFYYTPEWQPLYYSTKYGPEDRIDFAPPPHLREMLSYAAELSKPFPFVRMDFYDTGERVIFGEFTFTPYGGLGTDKTPESMLEMGQMVDLNYIPE